MGWEGERERISLPACVLPICLQLPGVGQSEARSLQLHPGDHVGAGTQVRGPSFTAFPDDGSEADRPALQPVLPYGMPACLQVLNPPRGNAGPLSVF